MYTHPREPFRRRTITKFVAWILSGGWPSRWPSINMVNQPGLSGASRTIIIQGTNIYMFVPWFNCTLKKTCDSVRVWHISSSPDSGVILHPLFQTVRAEVFGISSSTSLHCSALALALDQVSLLLPFDWSVWLIGFCFGSARIPDLWFQIRNPNHPSLHWFHPYLFPLS